MSMTKEHLHKLVEEFPDSEIEEAAHYLRRLRELAEDPVYQAFMNAPYDDEPLTPEEEAAIAEGEGNYSQLRKSEPDRDSEHSELGSALPATDQAYR